MGQGLPSASKPQVKSSNRYLAVCNALGIYSVGTGNYNS